MGAEPTGREPKAESDPTPAGVPGKNRPEIGGRPRKKSTVRHHHRFALELPQSRSWMTGMIEDKKCVEQWLGPSFLREPLGHPSKWHRRPRLSLHDVCADSVQPSAKWKVHIELG